MENSNVVSIITWAINVVRAYVIAGLVFAVPFVIFWAKRLDHNAKGSGLGFRIVVIPGVAAFWPLLAIRLLQGKTRPLERTAHRDLAAKHHIEANPENNPENNPEANPEDNPIQGG